MDYLSAIQNSVAQNNSWSAQQAQKQMDFQERMSNTAHVREVADLKAAGLNPVLSAKLGGASSPTGAMAEGDTSGTSALMSLFDRMLENQSARELADLQMRNSNEQLALKLDAQKELAAINNAAAMERTRYSSDASMDRTLLSLENRLEVARLNNDASMERALLQLRDNIKNSSGSGSSNNKNQTSGSGTLFGLQPIKNPTKPWQLLYNRLIQDENLSEFADSVVGDVSSSDRSSGSSSSSSSSSSTPLERWWKLINHDYDSFDDYLNDSNSAKKTSKTSGRGLSQR